MFSWVFRENKLKSESQRYAMNKLFVAFYVPTCVKVCMYARGMWNTAAVRACQNVMYVVWQGKARVHDQM